jgi:hypothetical protein
MDEDVRATIAAEEAKALRVIEPFHRSFEMRHGESSYVKT